MSLAYSDGLSPNAVALTTASEDQIHITPQGSVFVISSPTIGVSTLNSSSVTADSLTGSSENRTIALTRPSSSYTYLYKGEYASGSGANLQRTYLAFGSPTDAAARVNAVSGTYAIALFGEAFTLSNSNGSLTFNPAADRLSFSLLLNIAKNNTSELFFFDGTFINASNRFEGTISTKSGSYTGAFQARAFGPGGKELGFVIKLTGSDFQNYRALLVGVAS
ncbi:hypothetical protein E5673_08190 [Sphingomonas sp. PAMC26645]|uniref:hypothetical protein n=1 Tax=Sphingomonas sp. PAMC26645 TaxID=2565555 RepID=UPI00109DAC71|nr:hypothetical protein [Sphingomonas sp. PAMC26645]QCB42212.1 hypothetical protein E5673_08190 [Sphingomonas sp. PAMC26645]